MPLWATPPAVEALVADLDCVSDWEAAWVPSASEALDEPGWMSEERGEDFNSPGWLGVSVEAFWGTDEDMWVSAFRLVFVFVPLVCDAAPASFDARERGVVEEVVFVVHPAFFGWEDLAEEKKEQETETERDRDRKLICL